MRTGGFAKFIQEYPKRLQTLRIVDKFKSLVTPRTSKHTLSMSAPLTAPADMIDEPIVQVTEYLFLSGGGVASDYAVLKKNKIQSILNAALEVDNFFEDKNEFIYKRLDLQDHPSQQMCFVDVFENAFKFIGLPSSFFIPKLRKQTVPTLFR